MYVQESRSSGAAPERQHEDGPVRPRVDQEVAVGDGDAAVRAVGEVPRVEVELDQGRLVSTSPFRGRKHSSALRRQGDGFSTNRSEIRIQEPRRRPRAQHTSQWSSMYGTSFSEERRKRGHVPKLRLRRRLLCFHVHLGLRSSSSLAFWGLDVDLGLVFCALYYLKY